MDGCRIHKRAELYAAVGAAGCVLLVTPPYSPTFNPIEEVFSGFKAWIRRHVKYLQQQGFELVDVVDYAFQSIRPSHCSVYVSCWI